MGQCVVNGMSFITYETVPTASVTDVFGGDQYKFSNVPNKGLVIDLGANIGAFSIRAAYEKQCTVFCYEPATLLFGMLSKNIDDNKVGALVHPHKKAVTDVAGKRDFWFYKENGGGSSLFGHVYPPNTTDKEVVDCVTLKNVFEDNNISECDFLKMDIECSEMYVFKEEFLPYLRKCRVIAFEYHCSNLHSICDLMSKNGFDCGGYKKVICGGGAYLIRRI